MAREVWVQACLFQSLWFRDMLFIERILILKSQGSLTFRDRRRRGYDSNMFKMAHTMICNLGRGVACFVACL